MPASNQIDQPLLRERFNKTKEILKEKKKKKKQQEEEEKRNTRVNRLHNRSMHPLLEIYLPSLL